MNQSASCVGELAERLLGSGTPGSVTRLFQRSAYVRSGEEFVLLLWGGPRSPTTINVEGDPVTGGIRADERCEVSRNGVSLGSVRIGVEGADVFRSALVHRREVALPRREALKRGVGVLRSLYDGSPSGPKLFEDDALGTFAEDVLVPLASGRRSSAHSPASYLPLVGRGGGFTPAGDDFLGGFVATFNFVARCRGSKQIRMTRADLRGRTVPESANLLYDSARGYVDEGVEALILKSLGGGAGFSDELFEVARRGHTSGMDISLGVLLCEAAIADADGRGSALDDCLDVLRSP